jgi:hypothetical protein
MSYDWNLPALRIHEASNAHELGEAIKAILTAQLPHLLFLIAFKPRTFDLEMYTHPQEFQKDADRYVQSTHRYDIWMKRSPIHPKVKVVRHSDYTPTKMLKRSLYYRHVLKGIGSMHGASLVAWQGTEAASANLNVVWNRKTYVLEIQSDEEPFNSVTFYEPAEPGTASSKDSLGPIRLLGLLDKAKAYHLIQSQYPEAIPQVDTAQPHNRIAYQDFEVEVAEVFRFDPEDTLVFKILLYNHSEREIYYQPQTLAVRVGLDVFYSALSDASGIMPPANFNPETKKVEPSVSLAYFVVTGTPNGGRNNLAVTNTFNVIVNRQMPLIPLSD